MAGSRKTQDFGSLVAAIKQVHEHCVAQAGKAVNLSLTLRNWAIGCYIREYEQSGADRAQYRKELLSQLSKKLREEGSVEYHPRELSRCREFYIVYPQIGGTLSPGFDPLLPRAIRGTPSPELQAPAERLVTSLSFSHFAELIAIDDPLERAFYEVECIRSNWSVRELKRQIGSLYFERSGRSKDKEKLAALVKAGAEVSDPRLAVRDPYVFEFLGLRPREVMGESDLEDALLDKLQDFLLELGHGFCFEARQKRILIGESHGFVDLVFYHRILKCHVLVELKVAEFSHQHMGQLTTYVSWYKRNMMGVGDTRASCCHRRTRSTSRSCLLPMRRSTSRSSQRW